MTMFEQRTYIISAGRGALLRRLTPQDGQFLLASGWLSLCEPAFGEAVLARCRLQSVEAGEVLFHPGDPSSGIYGVVSGTFATSVVVREFGPSLSHLMLPGAWFGEAAYVGKPRTIGIHATRGARLAFLPMREIQALVAEDWRRWTSFAKLGSLTSQLAIGSAYDLMLRDPRQRCAATLLRLAGLRHAPPLQRKTAELDVTHSDLAHMTNLSRNSVAKILRDLRASGCLDWSYRQITIHDPARLGALLEGAD